MKDDDRDLYEAFQAVRREEATRVPAFSPGWQSNRERGFWRSSGRLAAATICLGMMMGVAVWLGLRARTPQIGHHGPLTAASVTTWKPSTDFLLETPGREVLYDVPAIGARRGAVLANGAWERHRGQRKQVVR